MVLSNLQFLGLGLFLIVNLGAFELVLIDKLRSNRQGSERIPEGLIFFVATAFGSIGIYLGMLTFRHKTRKWYFMAGIPLLLLENLAVVYVVNEFLISKR